MSVSFNDKISELLYRRFKDCLPLGLFKIWFRVKDGSLEGLGDLLGYSDFNLREMITYSELSKTNGHICLESWQQKLHIKTEVREHSIGSSKFKAVRFGDIISVGTSPEVLIPGNILMDWTNKTYKDEAIMEIYRLEYLSNFQSSHNIRNCSRLPVDIVQLLGRRKYQRRHNFDTVDEMPEANTNTEYLLRVDRNSTVDVAPHLTIFNSSFTEEEEEDIFVELLRKRNKSFQISVASPNNKLVNWFHFPHSYKNVDPNAEGKLSIGPVQMEGYKKRNSKAMIGKLCETIGGTLQRGHHILLQQLLEINEEWTDDILRDNGINVFGKLTPEETLSLQTQANLTTRQRLLIGKLLRHFNGGIQVLAAESEISKIDWKHCNSEMIFKTLTYFVDKNGKQSLSINNETEDGMSWVKKDLRYFYSNPYDVLIDRLNHFREITDKKNFVSIGMVMDNDQSKRLPLYIFITILGDHGGDEMKMVQMNNLRNGDGQSYTSCIGQFKNKESHFLFANTFFPPINNSIEELNKLMLLVVEWGTLNPGPGEEELAFDFLFYPKHMFLETDSYYVLPSLLAWRQNERGIDGVYYNNDDLSVFNYSDIPIDCRVRNINIECFVSGDTAFLQDLFDKKNFSSCRCLYCNLKHNEWQDQSVNGSLFTNADFERMQDDLLNVTFDELHGLMIEELELEQVEELHNNILEEAQIEAHRAGVALGQPSMLIPAVELATHFAIMVLHIKLGLALTLYNAFFLFIFEKLEIESDEVRRHRLDVNSAKITYQLKCQRLHEMNSDVNISTMERLRKEIVKNLKVKKDFENRDPNGRAPTVNQVQKYRDACDKLDEVEPQWNNIGYEIDDESLAHAEEEFERFGEEKQNAKDEEKEAKKTLSDAVKALALERKNQYHKPVKEATETIMCKYGIITQAYHSHSLIGEHCHRLLMHREKILDEVEAKWKEFVQDPRYENSYDVDIIADISKFSSQMSDLMEALDYCCSILARQNYWFNDNEIEEFQSVALYFGAIWREYLDKSVPPKLHVLEKHAHQFLSRWRNTGNFGEDSVERHHHDENQFNRMFSNKKGWEETKRLIRDRKAIYNNAMVTTTTNKILQATRTRKRSVNNDNNNSEYNKRQKKAEERINLIRKVVIKTPNNSSQDTQLNSLRGDEEDSPAAS